MVTNKTLIGNWTQKIDTKNYFISDKTIHSFVLALTRENVKVIFKCSVRKKQIKYFIILVSKPSIYIVRTLTIYAKGSVCNTQRLVAKNLCGINLFSVCD